jgi:hypothetical protein
MQLNIVQLYLNGLMKFLTFLKLSRYLREWIIHFELIETIIQTLHIALTSIY